MKSEERSEFGKYELPAWQMILTSSARGVHQFLPPLPLLECRLNYLGLFDLQKTSVQSLE
jgi:hypothetical protein